jgi:DNA-binding XRE family transcriptional regulator
MIASTAAYAVAAAVAERVRADLRARQDAELARRLAVIESHRYVSSPAALGTAVRAARRARKLTQAQLAAAARTGLRVVNELENNRRPHLSITAALAIAHAVGLEITVRHRETTP